MKNNLKTFRYTYIFKNLGVVYLIFLALGFWLTFSFDGDIIFLLVLIGVGVISTTIYLTTSASVSDEEITTKTLFGANSIKWSEVDNISSKRSSIMLKNRDGDITLRVNSRLDGYAQIFNLLYQKRADLFGYDKHNPFSRRVIDNIITLIIQLFFLMISIANLIFLILNKGDSTTHIIFIGLGISTIYSMINWFFSPQSLTVNSNSLTIKYFYKTVSYSKDEIVAISFLKGQAFVGLKNKMVIKFSVSGFAQSGFVVYYVLKRWHPEAIPN
jgi:hypothetical protein